MSWSNLRTPSSWNRNVVLAKKTWKKSSKTRIFVFCKRKTLLLLCRDALFEMGDAKIHSGWQDKLLKYLVLIKWEYLLCRTFLAMLGFLQAPFLVLFFFASWWWHLCYCYLYSIYILMLFSAVNEIRLLIFGDSLSRIWIWIWLSRHCGLG